MYVSRHSNRDYDDLHSPGGHPTKGMIRTKDMAPGDVRTKMVKGAAGLLATKGVEGTSFAEVLAVTDAPRGSIYHHFPGGKSELVHAALDLVSTRALAVMESKRGSSGEAIVRQFLDLWRQLLDHSELTAGCAVVAVTVAGSDDDLLDHAGAIFRDWTDHLAGLLVDGGVAESSAQQLAVMIIAATEGAVALCRAERSREPFDVVDRALMQLVSSEA
jgi:TetR/AcrR family transcriptional regulator, lmrAB and yxaGH operons repressor